MWIQQTFIKRGYCREVCQVVTSVLMRTLNKTRSLPWRSVQRGGKVMMKVGTELSHFFPGWRPCPAPQTPCFHSPRDIGQFSGFFSHEAGWCDNHKLKARLFSCEFVTNQIMKTLWKNSNTYNTVSSESKQRAATRWLLRVSRCLNSNVFGLAHITFEKNPDYFTSFKNGKFT